MDSFVGQGDSVWSFRGCIVSVMVSSSNAWSILEHAACKYHLYLFSLKLLALQTIHLNQPWFANRWVFLPCILHITSLTVRIAYTFCWEILQCIADFFLFIPRSIICLTLYILRSIPRVILWCLRNWRTVIVIICIGYFRVIPKVYIATNNSNISTVTPRPQGEFILQPW